MTPDTAVVVAHYHPRGLIRGDLTGLMSALQSLPASLLLVSTHLSAEQRDRVPPGTRVILRDNHGYDFYSYKVGQ